MKICDCCKEEVMDKNQDLIQLKEEFWEATGFKDVCKTCIDVSDKAFQDTVSKYRKVAFDSGVTAMLARKKDVEIKIL